MRFSVEDFAIFMDPLLQVPWGPPPCSSFTVSIQRIPTLFGQPDLVVVCNLLSMTEELSENKNKILKKKKIHYSCQKKLS